MSFVGPRPETPELAILYPEKAMIMFTIKPGLVGPASIHGRNEEESYPLGVDVKKYYIKNLLPVKVEKDKNYILKPTFFNYIKYLLLGINAAIVGVLSKRQINSNQPQIYLLIADILFVIAAYLLSYNWTVWQENNSLEIIHSTRLLPVVILVRLLCNQYFGLYRSLLEYIQYYDLYIVFKSNVLGTLLLLLIAGLFKKESYSLYLAVLDLCVLSILTAGLRFALFKYNQKKSKKDECNYKQAVLIFGACEDGIHAYRSIMSDRYGSFNVIGFLDDAPYKLGKTIGEKSTW